MNTLPTKLFAAAATMAAAALIPAVQTVAGGVNGPRAYNSSNSSERVTAIRVSPTYPYPKANVYCINLGTPPAVGETLAASAEVEVTNDLGYKVLWQTQIVLADSCTAATGTEITESNGFNLLPDVHHGMVTKYGTLTVTAATARHYVVLQSLAKALLGAPYKSGDVLKVEPDYGRLTVLRWPS